MTEDRGDLDTIDVTPNPPDEWSAIAGVQMRDIMGGDEFLSYAPPTWRANRLTRLLIGLSGGDSDALSKYPYERPRYIGLGWTMVATSAMAMIGMAVLLTQITDMSLPVRVLLSAGWALFVLGIDYLVVGFVDKPSILADTLSLPGHPSRPGRSLAVIRAGVRVAFAIIVGLAVGESLVIGVFGSATDEYLDQRAAAEMQAQLCLADATLSHYRPEVVPAPDCRQQLARAGIEADLPNATPDSSSSASGDAAAMAARAQFDREMRNSPQAQQAAARKTVLETELVRVQQEGPYRAYGLSERFEATQKAVSPWIRWGLILLFVIADMAPVLMKTTMGPSAIDVDRVLADHEAWYPKLVDAAHREDEYERARRAYGGGGVSDPPADGAKETARAV